MSLAVKEQQVIFQIKGIELLGVQLNQPNQPLPVQTTFHFVIRVEHHINSENKLILVIASIDIVHEDLVTQLASVKVKCIFETQDFDDFSNDLFPQIPYPENILISLNSITLSTVRGIMFSELKGTFLHNAILPIVDPITFLKTQTA